jgi:hypothetical protein
VVACSRNRSAAASDIIAKTVEADEESFHRRPVVEGAMEPSEDPLREERGADNAYQVVGDGTFDLFDRVDAGER